MAKVCEICGKGSIKANRITRRGKAKKEGGVGRHITKVAARRQKPNLKKIKAIVDGSPTTVKVCTQCIKSGRVERAY